MAFTDLDKLKNIVDSYYTDNYDFILNTSKNIQNKNLRNVTEYDTLVILSYEYIVGNLVKLRDIIESDKVESVVVNWMYKQVIWKETTFKKEWIYSRDIPFCDMNSDDPDGIEFDVEDKLDDIDDVLRDEMDHQDKMNIIISNRECLGEIDKRLYQLVFDMGHDTSGKLSRITGIPRTSCWVLIKDMKKKLRKER